MNNREPKEKMECMRIRKKCLDSSFQKSRKRLLVAKIRQIKTYNKFKNIRDLYSGINILERGFQGRINMVKDGESNLSEDSELLNILERSRKYFQGIFNSHVSLLYVIFLLILHEVIVTLEKRKTIRPLECLLYS